ncbi:MAG: YdeI/OmpD-associated family protein [Roseiflexaceae bacterium]
MAEPPPNSVHPLIRAVWREWLAANSTRTEGIWVISYKKASGQPSIPYEDLIEEALCFGWIDSTAKGLDQDRSMLWLAPRKPRTGWSRPNKERIERILAAGLMTEAGLRKIEAAKQDGSWFLLDSVEALEIPPDLGEALDSHPPARANFEAFPRSVKRSILEWIVIAKTPTTRQRRIDETAQLAQQNRCANQWREQR